MHKVHYIVAGLWRAPIAGGIPIEEEYLVPSPIVLPPNKCAAHSNAINQALQSYREETGQGMIIWKQETDWMKRLTVYMKTWEVKRKGLK